MFFEYVEKSKKEFPKLKIKYKDKSLFMKFLSFVLFFNKDFSKKYITTIGSTIYFPSQKYVETNDLICTIILMHELVHIKDYYKFKILFSFLYLFPQILFPLFILGFFNPYFFIFSIFIIPIPALFRAYFEYKAYIMSMYATHQLSHKYDFNWSPDIAINSYIKNFVTSNYYYMFPFKNYLIKCFYIKFREIQDDLHPFDDEIYKIVDRILK